MTDFAAARDFIDAMWDAEIIAQLSDYIRIPNKSPAFDPDWAANGHMEEAVGLFAGWARAKIAAVPGATLEVVRLEARTPLILIDLPGAGGRDDSVLLYGHLDKQPEMEGWSDGLGPWVPALIDGKLYGRGGADDGYAMFASLAAILALRAQATPVARCIILIEGCEESGSFDLPHYIDHLGDRIGNPSLVICLDSGCGNYEQLWLTTSLRGILAGSLTVEVLSEGVHSGSASGIVPDSFRIARQLLSRLEDPVTGGIIPAELRADIPDARRHQARIAAESMQDSVWTEFPFVEGMRPAGENLTELLLDRSWRAKLAVIGADHLPSGAAAGNVLRPATGLKLSIRIPPGVSAHTAGDAVERLLEAAPPYGAAVRCVMSDRAEGWEAPAMAPWLERAVDNASEIAFGRPAAYMGEGGTIPFMIMLGRRFPAAQFVITGVLGPHSNAHGPNEFLHIAAGKNVTLAIAKILEAHAQRN